ncbi:hypothetical protein ABZ054_34465, partial [Streptomyces sp. NPDC006324]
MPEGDDSMRGSAAPTSPGAWDARSEALLGAPALRAGTVEDPPPGIVQAPGAATATPLRPHPAAPALRKDQEDRGERPAEPPTTQRSEGGDEDRDEPPADRDAPDTAPAPPPPPAAQAVPAAPRPRHGTADPVRVLMHRHRELCERAVDPLDVAAGLEARGFTDRTAARYRHRDVFSLAPRRGPAPLRGRRRRHGPGPLRRVLPRRVR